MPSFKVGQTVRITDTTEGEITKVAGGFITIKDFGSIYTKPLSVNNRKRKIKILSEPTEIKHEFNFGEIYKNQFSELFVVGFTREGHLVLCCLTNLHYTIRMTEVIHESWTKVS